MMQAEFLHAGDLFFGRRRAIHFHAKKFADLDCSGAHTSSNGVDEHSSALRLIEQPSLPVGEVGGKEIDGKSGAFLGAPVRWHRPEQIRPCRDVLRERSPLDVSHNPIAISPGPTELASCDQWRFWSSWIPTASRHGIGEVQAPGLHPDQFFTTFWTGCRDVLNLQNLRATQASYNYSFHDNSLATQMCIPAAAKVRHLPNFLTLD